MAWDRPERFRRVCPALQRSPEGWMCSLDTAAVRPYWIRALGWWAGAAVAAYVLLATGAAGALRARGYRDITPLDTLLPTRWSRVTTARRDVFLRQAQAALAQRDVAAMWVSLSSAAAAAPDDYEVRLALAQMYSHLLMNSLAETEFRDLLQRFPDQRAKTAVVFHDVLVTRGEFEALGRLALGQLAEPDTTEKAAWIRALMLALRGSRDPGQVLRSERDAFAALPQPWQNAIRCEAAVRGGDTAAVDQWLAVPVNQANAALVLAGAETLVDHAAPAAAIEGIVRASPAIGAFESERLLHRLHVREGAEKLALKSFDAMLAHARTAPERERLLAVLVEHPNFDRVNRLASALGNHVAPFAANEAGSVWVAAAIAGNDAVRQLAERRLQHDHGLVVPPDMPRELSGSSVTAWMKMLPLTRETAAALVMKAARMHQAVSVARG